MRLVIRQAVGDCTRLVIFTGGYMFTSRQAQHRCTHGNGPHRDTHNCVHFSGTVIWGFQALSHPQCAAAVATVGPASGNGRRVENAAADLYVRVCNTSAQTVLVLWAQSSRTLQPVGTTMMSKGAQSRCCVSRSDFRVWNFSPRLRGPVVPLRGGERGGRCPPTIVMMRRPLSSCKVAFALCPAAPVCAESCIRGRRGDTE